MSEQASLQTTRTPDTRRTAAVAEDSARAHAYSLLGTVLANPPTSEVLDLLRAIEAAPAGNGDNAMVAAWHTLRLASERATLDALDDEFHELFIGIGRGELVPFGSWYLVGFMMDKPLVALRQDLMELGFERQEGVHEPEDHAAALCETMSMIITGGEVDFARQRQFFADHIGPWMGRFFADLQAAKAARFYRAVGQLGEQFIELEKQYFAMLT